MLIFEPWLRVLFVIAHAPLISSLLDLLVGFKLDISFSKSMTIGFCYLDEDGRKSI